MTAGERILVTQYAKIRVLNEETGREWIGYAECDHTGWEPTLKLRLAETFQRVCLRWADPRYFWETI